MRFIELPRHTGCQTEDIVTVNPDNVSMLEDRLITYHENDRDVVTITGTHVQMPGCSFLCRHPRSLVQAMLAGNVADQEDS